ncbi:tetratricopeptide repeat protein [Novilysobacter antarcticus]|uniref:O-linked N-acetylglucosamine transferase, SPINDLY family protein n=1 Tax=Novilysobacter antarcticus TaxID=2862543 RepID=UPI0031BB412A
MRPVDPRSEARLAVEREPGSPLAWILLAEAELDAGDAAAGETASRRALALLPGHPEALARLGRAQWMQGRHQDAAESLGTAAKRAPGHPGIAVWLAHVLEDIGQPEQAADQYARAHRLAPEEPQLAAYLLAWRRKLCDWRDLDALSTQVRDAVRHGQSAVEPFAFLSEDSTAAEQLACARLRAAGIARAVRPLPPPPPEPRAADARKALRVGFLSNGFGAHPTGLLTVALFEALASQPAIAVHLFALNADDGSAIRQRLKSATRLHDVAGRSHTGVARVIRDAQIDVLFDLRGWGGGGRPEVLAMRPAPLQVNWLAYPGTSGAPWIDVVLADRFVLPPSLAHGFSERVDYLPRCFQPSDTSRALAAPPGRAECGLPAPGTGVVFCCFNNSYKLNPASMRRAWAVLAGVPDSVLWLLSGPGRADQRLRDAAAAAGVAPSRLVFMPKQPHDRYLARLQHADLFLDTNPYNAHTTASDALWAGCPVLTRPGETFAARVAGSLNHHLGMPQMNVATDDQFIQRAIELGRDPALLQAARGALRERRRTAGVFDMDGFAADFAAAVLAMAEQHGTA